jgi:hypothetical protein
MPGVTSFQITVPRKVAAGQLPINAARAIVSMETAAAVTFQVTDPRGAPVATIGPISAGSPAPALSTFTPTPPGAVNFDVLVVTPPSGTLPANDPLRRIYSLYFDLLSDYDPNNNCATTMVANETWTVSVTAGSPEMSGVCLQSFDLNILGAECGGTMRLVPISEPVATVVGFPASSCLEVRPGVDSALVLDRSGSMSSSTLGGAPQPKIEALQDAVEDFVNVWNSLRASEGASTPTDNIGVTLFDHNAAWWSITPGGLNPFSTTQDDILNNVGTLTTGGATSIGDGLELADAALSSVDPSRRRVILLMSDGYQNSDRMVAVVGNQVRTHTLAAPATQVALPNQSNYQIYSVTVGSSTAVAPQINQDIATATRGFYVNSEDNSGLLSPFFLELLQNFVHFNSWEIYRLVSERVSHVTSLPVTSTSQFVSFNLRWPKRSAQLRLRVQPPGEAQPTEAIGQENIVMRFDLPTSAAYNYLGEWQVQIEIVEIITHIEPGAKELPFELVVLGEDASLHSEMTLVARDYIPGDQIELEARLVEFGRPLIDVANQPGSTLVAQIVKPGVSIGDLLSSSSASSTPPASPDIFSPAEAKLHNELQANPDALVRDASDTVTLVDNGNGEYRGTYTVQTPGHYNFLFALQGQTRNAGNFSRMQLKTIYVRPAPDSSQTQIQTSVSTGGGGNQFLITMTPRTRFAHKLGPGWKNYFWFKTPGLAAVTSSDNLDGTYTASIPYSGATPPPVSIHFLPISMVIGDSVTETQLPLPLDGSNTLITEVDQPQTSTQRPWWWLILIILLILFLLYLLWELLT